MAFVSPARPGIAIFGRRTANISKTQPIRASADHTPGSDNLAEMRAALGRSLEKPLVIPDLFTSGECDCIWCDGTGQRRCPWCKGCGVREELLESSWQEIIESKAEMTIKEGELELPQPVKSICPLCTGSKKMTCSRCKGSGVGGHGHAH